MKVHFSKSAAEEILWGGHEDFEVLEDVQYGSSRWMGHYSLTLKGPGGSLWQTTYSRGLTEQQDDGIEWDEMEGPLVVFYPAKAVEKTIIEYVRAD